MAIDNNYAIWRGFNNEYWPADYFIDADGHIRAHQFGEGGYDQAERVIQDLLREAGDKAVPAGTVSVAGGGIEQAADMADIQSPETYVGTDRATNFVSPGGAIPGQTSNYTVPATLALNQWALAGTWKVGAENGVLAQPGGEITFRFHARDLNLVLGPSQDGKPIRFQVMIDGHAPASDHGVDIDAAGNGTVMGERLYQLIRLDGPVSDHIFSIRFLDPGVDAYSFTFG